MEVDSCRATKGGACADGMQPARLRGLRGGAERAADRRGGVHSDGRRQRPGADRKKHRTGACDCEHDEDYDGARGA